MFWHRDAKFDRGMSQVLKFGAGMFDFCLTPPGLVVLHDCYPRLAPGAIQIKSLRDFSARWKLTAESLMRLNSYTLISLAS